MRSQNYGTVPVIRQCILPGMRALYHGQVYSVSVVSQRNKKIYLHTLREKIRVDDNVLEIMLDGRGIPLIQ